MVSDNFCSWSFPERMNVILTGIVILLISVFTIMANSTIIYVFIFKVKRYEEISDLLLLLSTSNFLVGLISYPIYAFRYIYCSTHEEDCKNNPNLKHIIYFASCVTSAGTFFSASTILFITLDIYLGLLRPFSKWNKKQCFCILTCVWLFFLVIDLLRFYIFPDLKIGQTLEAAIVLTLYTIIGYIHYRIKK